MKPRIAIIGSGVSGLVAARELHADHEVTVFEARDRIGGHVNTVQVELDGRPWEVDTGFIVYNETNYPNLTRLFRELWVETQPSNMSFSVRCDRSGLEYNGSTLRQLFVQKRNLLRPGHYRMIRDILRFNAEAPAAIANGAGQLTLGGYLELGGYSAELADHYLVPMGSALWSMPRGEVLDIPARFFVEFFDNHGMLTVDERPEWRVVTGGSSSYLAPLIEPFRDRIRTSTPVRSVVRARDHVRVDGERFDQVVFACHSDQALRILENPTKAEREVLSALPYQDNRVVLHTDTRVLPRRRAAWGAWNYHVREDASAPATVTYDMNILQSLDAPETFCVTLNPPEWLDERAILYETVFAHPVYTIPGAVARTRRAEISGGDRTHYCGAYWGFGFHEDGVKSGLEAAAAVRASGHGQAVSANAGGPSVTRPKIVR